MRFLILILTGILTIFGATYTVTPIPSKVLMQDIGFTPDDTTWQLKTVVDSYHIGGQTWDRTYWGTTKSDVRFYYWCGGEKTWCYKVVSQINPNCTGSNIWNENGKIYVWKTYNSPISTELMVNYIDTLWYDTVIAKTSGMPVDGNQGLFLKFGSSDSIQCYDSTGNLIYQMHGDYIEKDLQNNVQIIYLNTAYAKMDIWTPLRVVNRSRATYYSPEDTNYFQRPFFNNNIDTLKYTFSEWERNKKPYVYSNRSFYIPYAKHFLYIDWSSKQVYTYAFPESATTDIYMPSFEKVYYGRNNVNKIMYLNYKPEFIASLTPDSGIVAEPYICSLYISDKNTNQTHYFFKLEGPDWLNVVDSSNNWISGAPTDTGTFTITVRVRDELDTASMDDTVTWMIYVKKLETKNEVNVISQNSVEIYPNPFNPSTSINLELCKASTVKVTVCNLKGQIVKLIDNTQMTSGRHSISFKGMTSGMYICKVWIGNESKTIVMNLIK